MAADFRGPPAVYPRRTDAEWVEVRSAAVCFLADFP